MVKLQINSKDVLLMVMDYLKEHNMLSSLLMLEKESSLALFKYSKEIQFLRNLILEGQWQDADGFIKTIFEQESSNKPESHDDLQNLNQINYQIKKQIYLELLHSNDLEKNQNYVVELIKELESLSMSKDDHFELCNLLNYTRLQNHPDYADWTVQIGRFSCFNNIKNMLNECQTIQIGENHSIEKRRAPVGRLSKLLKDSVLY